LHLPSEDSKLRVLLVSSSSGSIGGGELYLVGLAEGLKTLDHEVQALLSNHPRMDDLAELLRPWANVHREQYTNTYDRRLRSIGAVLDRSLIRRLSARLRGFHPDVIHINKQNLEDGLDLVLAAKKSGLPLVSTIHITRDPASLQALIGPARGWIARTVLRRAQTPCLTIARICADQLAKQLGSAVPRSLIYCVANGVRDAPPSDRETIRCQWHCKDGEFVLGCLARIVSQKNPLFLVSLLPDLPKNVRLCWVGDGRLHGELLNVAQRLGVRDRVWIEGWRDDARILLAGFDLFILPSRYEGLPLAILEAMAAGLPCVASAVDGSQEALIHGESGFLCPPNNRNAWLSCLRALIANQSQRRSVGQSARRRYLECFTLDAMARGTVDVYRKVISASRT
jgi:glycosyltransferase involved in cell wall biosynthesis